MNQDIKIVNYGPAFEKAHYEFATKMFGNRRKRRNPDYIYWKFRGNQDRELSSFKLAVADGVIIGQLGLIPCEIDLGDEIVDSQWACDLMVSPDFRGKGVAKLLYDSAHNQKEITLGSDPSPSAEISMLRAGYKKLKSSNKQFIPIYLGLPLRMKGIKINFLDEIKNPFLSIFLKKKNIASFKEIDIIKANHQDLFQTNKKNQVSIARSESFKKWRYSSFKDYYPGVKLFNLNETKTYFSGYHHGKIYFITDLFLEEENHFNKAINYILNLIPKEIERIRFQNNISNDVMGSKLAVVKYRTETSIIYFTKNKNIESKISDKYFYYTHQDSDENI